MTSKPMTFVIVDKDVFVAHDMQLGLEYLATGCNVIHLRDIPGCVTVPNTLTRRVFITKLSIEQIDQCGLVQIAGPDADIVVREGVDTREAVAERGWFSLASPFTTDDLAVLVQELRAPAQAEQKTMAGYLHTRPSQRVSGQT